MKSIFCYKFSYITYFTPCSSASVVNFEQVNGDWDQIAD